MENQRVVCFGEIMCRLSPEGYLRLSQANRLELFFGGAEANVAASLAMLGISSCFVTRLPENDLGEMAIGELRRHGVDTRYITKGDGRMGLYFLEKGASQRPSRVLYDRCYSALTQTKPEDFNWDEIFENASWFHLTGITPALGGNIPDICLEAVKCAKKHGLTVSFDPNYRQSLWSREEASAVLSPMMEYVDLCITNEGCAADVFGIRTRKSGEGGLRDITWQILEKFGTKKIALTSRRSISASDNVLCAMLFSDGEFYFSRDYNVHIVDRVGAGDAFAAGLIYSEINQCSPEFAIEFATAAACLKHTIEGDMNIATADEIKALADGDCSGRIRR